MLYKTTLSLYLLVSGKIFRRFHHIMITCRKHFQSHKYHIMIVNKKYILFIKDKLCSQNTMEISCYTQVNYVKIFVLCQIKEII